VETDSDGLDAALPGRQQRPRLAPLPGMRSEGEPHEPWSPSPP